MGPAPLANGRKLFDSSQKSTSRENSGMTESDASRQPVRWLLPFWVMIATLTTAIGFGTLALSEVPVLHALGVTVGPGAVLALLLSAIFVPRATPR